MDAEIDLGIADLEQFEKIGAGGFATVYKAWDRVFRRWVAVKVLQSLDARGQRAFDRERRLMGQFDKHANVVTPYSSGYTAIGSPYVVMEHLPGGSLQDLIERNGPLPVETAVGFIIPIAQALGAAHAAGVIHRDVKPANILLSEDDVPKLTDFGIGTIREATAIAPATATQIAYTMAHSPPETFSSGEDVRDERSDLYSLASTLYTLISGRTPFESDRPSDSQLAFMRRIEIDPVPQTGHTPLDAFLGRAMAKDPAERHTTAIMFVEGLQDLSAESPADKTVGAGPDTKDPETDPVAAVTLLAPRRGRDDSFELDDSWPASDVSPVGPCTADINEWGHPSSCSCPEGYTYNPETGRCVLANLRGQTETQLDERPLPPRPFQDTLTSRETAVAPTPEVEHAAGKVGRRQRRAVVLVAGLAILAVVALSALVLSRDNIPEPVPTGHSRLVDVMIQLDDGRIASGSADDTVRVWDPDNPLQDVVVYTGHNDNVAAVIQLADGRMASAGWDEAVRIWDIDSPEDDLVVFSGHSSWVLALAELQDGRIASADSGGTVMIWDPDDIGQDPIMYSEHQSRVNSVVELPDGQLATTSPHTNVVRIWNPNSLETTRIIDLQAAYLGVFGDGSLAFQGSGVIDPDTGEIERFSGLGGRHSAIAELIDGRVAIGLNSGFKSVVAVVDRDSGEIEAELELPGSGVFELLTLTDGRVATVVNSSEVDNGIYFVEVVGEDLQLWRPSQSS